MVHLLSLYAHHRVNAMGGVAAALRDKKEQQYVKTDVKAYPG
jgi:hypothetical protein